jgi:hypothetical protein
MLYTGRILKGANLRNRTLSPAIPEATAMSTTTADETITARDADAPARPLALSDEQMSAILTAAEPLPPDLRSPFLAAVAHALQGREPLGDGLVFRTIRELQREFFRAPDLKRNTALPRWARKGGGVRSKATG